MSGITNIPSPHNEPVLSYAPGTPERVVLKSALGSVGNERPDIPVVVGDREIRTGDTYNVTSPHCHSRVLATMHQADQATIDAAVTSAVETQRDWAHWRFEDRAAVFLRAADLLAGRYRQRLNAATMLGQSKTAFQAEIDSACELIDFLRFNVYFAERIYQEQPASAPGAWNRMDHRPLEGFVYAITPFNFTAIGGNLPTAPALMGNTVVWKPSHTAALSNWHFYQLLREAGLPPGVINFVPGDAVAVSRTLLGHPEFAGIHFTGSTAVFQSLWKTIGDNLARYRSYPRIVGETGGKDFIVAHPSADVDAVATAILRGSFEYQGQKCSAASRVYAPSNLWPELRERLVEEVGTITMGDVSDFSNFMGAVIDAKSFARQREAIEHAKANNAEVLVGGGTNDSEGYFVEPTVIETKDPRDRLMSEEFFGPIVTTYVYPEDQWEQTLELVDDTAAYGLTGAIFSQERAPIDEAQEALRYTAGNFYVNDKPTGAVVGQQPFGGSRASGTNDKAGSMWNLIRWVSPRTIKETFVPPRDYRYSFLDASDTDGRPGGPGGSA